jgi:hypothetical protein
MRLLERRKAALAQCLEHAVLERKSEDAFQLGPGAFARLLSELCRKRGAKRLFRVGKLRKPLSAAAKAYSMLKRGEAATIESVNGKMAVPASSLEELLEKLPRG